MTCTFHSIDFYTKLIYNKILNMFPIKLSFMGIYLHLSITTAPIGYMWDLGVTGKYIVVGVFRKPEQGKRGAVAPFGVICYATSNHTGLSYII